MSDPLYRDPLLEPRRVDDLPRGPYDAADRTGMMPWVLGALVAVLLIGGLLYYNSESAKVATAPSEPATITRTNPSADPNTGAGPTTRTIPEKMSREPVGRELPANPAPAPERQ